MTSIEDIHWAAGFLEGEGSFTYHSSLMVAASQTSMWPLERMQRIFGGKISRNGRQNEGRKVCYSWYLYGHHAAAVMMTVYGLVSPRRREQIAAALEKWKPRPVTQGLRLTCPKGHLYRRSGRQRYCPTCSDVAHKNWLARKNVDAQQTNA
jgi:hypothetical protein